MLHIFQDNEACRNPFTFKFSAAPVLRLSFELQAPALTDRPFKRRRALSDVDGNGNAGRKKRRLRLHLITSRLSLPFSQPASNIVNRGVNKIPVWGAKNKALGRSLLRKAAIMNRVRKRMDAARDFMEQEKTRERLSLRQIVIQKPRCLDVPLPPSPLGLSNYDALDLEDEENAEDWHGSFDQVSNIYSDFNIMNPAIDRDDPDALDDYLDALDGISPRDLPATPPEPSGECISEMLREDRQGEGIFVQVR